MSEYNMAVTYKSETTEYLKVLIHFSSITKLPESDEMSCKISVSQVVEGSPEPFFRLR